MCCSIGHVSDMTNRCDSRTRHLLSNASETAYAICNCVFCTCRADVALLVVYNLTHPENNPNARGRRVWVDFWEDVLPFLEEHWSDFTWGPVSFTSPIHVTSYSLSMHRVHVCACVRARVCARACVCMCDQAYFCSCSYRAGFNISSTIYNEPEDSESIRTCIKTEL